MCNVEQIKQFMEEVVRTDGYNAVDLAVEAKYEFNVEGNNVPVELLRLARQVLLNRKCEKNG
jgi:hypothetical protein